MADLLFIGAGLVYLGGLAAIAHMSSPSAKRYMNNAPPMRVAMLRVAWGWAVLSACIVLLPDLSTGHRVLMIILALVGLLWTELVTAGVMRVVRKWAARSTHPDRETRV